MLKIQQNVPMPTEKSEKAGSLRSVMRELAASKVGASLFVPKDMYSTNSVRGAVQMVGPGWARTLKVIEGDVEGTRVWKIADLPAPQVAAKDSPRK